MSKLTDDCMSGMEVRDPARDDYEPVDFAVTSDTASLVFLDDWWNGDLNADQGWWVYQRPLVASSEPSSPWVVQGTGVTIGPSDELGDRLKRNRDASDFERPTYLSALLDLKAQLPEFNFDDWIAAYRARPLRDAVVEAMKVLTAPRQMAKVFMVDSTGRPVDVLVIDDRGDAATTGADGWLDRAADDFVSQKGRHPPVADYVNWLSGQTPYGTNALTGASAFTSDGLLDDVAARLMAARRT